MGLIAALLTIFAAVHGGEAEPCQRIVSLAPSVTETLYALDLGDRIVGVSQYSFYPPEARLKPSVGGLLDVNSEAIIALKPDIVIGLAESREKGEQLSSLGLNVEIVDQRSVLGILDSIQSIGKLCRAEGRSASLRSSLESAIQLVREQVRDKPKTRVLVLVGEGVDEDSMRSLFISGRDGFYSQLLEIAGGENVYRGVTSGLPSLSAEGLLMLDPDVIIQVQPAGGLSGDGERMPGVIVRRLPELRAVREGRVHVFRADYAVVPGPRFVALLNDFVRVLHP